jgi:hypothetical protein
MSGLKATGASAVDASNKSAQSDARQAGHFACWGEQPGRLIRAGRAAKEDLMEVTFVSNCLINSVGGSFFFEALSDGVLTDGQIFVIPVDSHQLYPQKPVPARSK